MSRWVGTCRPLVTGETLKKNTNQEYYRLFIIKIILAQSGYCFVICWKNEKNVPLMCKEPCNNLIFAWPRFLHIHFYKLGDGQQNPY